MTLTCAICAARFERPGRRGPIPQFCSTRCKGKRDHARPGRREWERKYRRARRAQGLDLTDNVARRDYYRDYWRTHYGDPHPGLEIPAPYTGHRWLDMARAAVGPEPDPAFRDYSYNDEVGEAVLALLEGRDMKQAVQEHRSREFVPRHLTLRIGEWRDDEGEDWVERELPPVESAEDEAIGRLEVAARVRWHVNRVRGLSARRHNQPTRRRMRDAGLREHRRGGLRVA